VINIVLNYILIKHAALGVTGAAVATTLSQVVISVLSVTVLYRRSSIQPLTIQYLKPVLGSGLVAMVVFALAKSLPLHGWMLPLYLLLFLFGYMASIVMLRAVDHEDLFLLEAISRKTGVDLSALTAFLKRRLQRS
jgi:O-antigen/teichoic acid export membrane protein